MMVFLFHSIYFSKEIIMNIRNKQLEDLEILDILKSLNFF